MVAADPVADPVDEDFFELVGSGLHLVMRAFKSLFTRYVARIQPQERTLAWSGI